METWLLVHSVWLPSLQAYITLPPEYFSGYFNTSDAGQSRRTSSLVFDSPTTPKLITSRHRQKVLPRTATLRYPHARHLQYCVAKFYNVYRSINLETFAHFTSGSSDKLLGFVKALAHFSNLMVESG